jgi:hypothetical protein
MMKRKVNSSIVLRTMDFPHLHLDLINSFLERPLPQSTWFSAKGPWVESAVTRPQMSMKKTFEHTGLWDRGDMYPVHYRHGDLVSNTKRIRLYMLYHLTSPVCFLKLSGTNRSAELTRDPHYLTKQPNKFYVTNLSGWPSGLRRQTQA